ncbi:MAG: ABC transporter substrate-binding protein [Hyphomicrobiales bacterium]|nr:ABC transporter substrate-binding protein [Hyphomicrobiales bacterium]
MGAFWKNLARLIAAPVILLALSLPALTADHSIKSAYRLTFTSIAVTKGDFAEKYDLAIKPITFPTGIEINEALLTGSVDVGEVGIAPLATLLTRTSDVVAVGVTDIGGGRYKTVVRKESPYKSMDDLLGKKVAIKVGSGNYAAFLTYIKSRGWKESDFQIVNAGDQEAIAALTEGSVDGVIYWEPIVSTLIAKGIARPIFSFKGVVNNPTFLVMPRKFVENERETAIRFIAAYMDTQELLSTDVPAAAKLVVKGMSASGQKVDPKVIELAIPSVDYKIEMGSQVIADEKATWQLLKDTGKLRGDEPDWSVAFDGSLIEAAKKLRGE